MPTTSTTQCRIDIKDRRATALRLSALVGNCLHTVEFSERGLPLANEKHFLGYRFFAVFDANCRPGLSDDFRPVPCDKAEGDAIWLFATPSGYRPEVLSLQWRAEVIDKDIDGLGVYGLRQTPNAAAQETDGGGVKHLVTPVHGMLLSEPLLLVSRPASAVLNYGEVRLELLLRRRNGAKAKDLKLSASLPIALHAGSASGTVAFPHDVKDPEVSLLLKIDRINLSESAILKDYRRANPKVRADILTFIGHVKNSLTGGNKTLENYVLWAPPGSGKSYLIKEFAKASSAPRIEFVLFSASDDKKEEFMRKVEKVRNQTTLPVLCLFDEMDTARSLSWSCEAAFDILRLNEKSANQVVCVVAGSDMNGLDAMIEKIRKEPNKGPDLVDSLGRSAGYRLNIPAPDSMDRVVMFLSHLFSDDKHCGRVRMIDKLALYFLLKASNCTSARAVSDLARKVAPRLEAGAIRVTLNHMFASDDNELSQFVVRFATAVNTLGDSTIHVER